MSLIKTIQEYAANPEIRIEDLLRNCLVLAYKLDNPDFKKWVESELSGYEENQQLPEYRILYAQALGNFAGAWGSGLKNISIPPSALPEQFRDFAMKAYIRNPISTLRSLVEDSKSNSDTLELAWPAELIVHMSGKIFKGYSLYAAYQVFHRGAIVGIIDNVKNRILKFILEVGSENLEFKEGEIKLDPSTKERIYEKFFVTVYGNVGNIGSHEGELRQYYIEAGDFEGLRQALIKLNVTESDINNLKIALENDVGRTSDPQIGDETSSWIGKMISKASTGTFKISTAVACEIITKIISQYLGLNN